MGMTMPMKIVPMNPAMRKSISMGIARISIENGSVEGVATAANEGYNSNAGFVVTDDGVVVIDALGTPALGEALLQAIRRVTPHPGGIGCERWP